MKTLFCWRCQMDIPMLDEEEYSVIRKLFGQCFSAIKEYRQQNNITLENISRQEHFRPVLQKYQEMTGFEETEPNAIMHHRIALYGPPCKRCGKVLRSPKAAFCAACGEGAS